MKEEGSRRHRQTTHATVVEKGKIKGELVSEEKKKRKRKDADFSRMQAYYYLHTTLFFSLFVVGISFSFSGGEIERCAFRKTKNSPLTPHPPSASVGCPSELFS